MTPLRQIDEKLNQYLRLQSPAVAVAMLKPEDVSTVDAKAKRTPMPVCQGLALSRRYGWKTIMGREEMTCPVGGVAMGFLPPKPKYLDGSFAVPLWVKTQEARARIAKEHAKLEYGKYQLMKSAPLISADFEPDLILVFGNSAQMMRLAQSCAYWAGESLVSSMTGGAGCANYISKALLTNQCQFVLLGSGDRINACTQDTEDCFSIPMARIEGVLGGLEGTHKAGARYPVTSYLRYRPEFPESYRNLLDMLQETT